MAQHYSFLSHDTPLTRFLFTLTAKPLNIAKLKHGHILHHSVSSQGSLLCDIHVVDHFNQRTCKHPVSHENHVC